MNINRQILAAVIFLSLTWVSVSIFNHFNPYIGIAIALATGVLTGNYVYKQIKNNEK